MTNKERKEYYFNQAKEEFKRIGYYQNKRNWNMVIRKAQETIEFLLKGVLKYMNIEFPKEHDIGKYFGDILSQKKIDTDPVILERIKKISEELSEKRAPAYYGEVFYSKEEAVRAKKDTEFVYKYIKDLLKKLEK